MSSMIFKLLLAQDLETNTEWIKYSYTWKVRDNKVPLKWRTWSLGFPVRIVFGGDSRLLTWRVCTLCINNERLLSLECCFSIEIILETSQILI